MSIIRWMLIPRLRKMMLVYKIVEEILSILEILERFPRCFVGWISFPFDEVFVFAWIILNTNLLLKRKISLLMRIFALESTSDNVVNFVFVLSILVVWRNISRGRCCGCISDAVIIVLLHWGKRRLSGCVRLKREDILYGFKNEMLMTLCALIDLGKSTLYALWLMISRIEKGPSHRSSNFWLCDAVEKVRKALRWIKTWSSTWNGEFLSNRWFWVIMRTRAVSRCLRTISRSRECVVIIASALALRRGSSDIATSIGQYMCRWYTTKNGANPVAACVVLLYANSANGRWCFHFFCWCRV